MEAEFSKQSNFIFQAHLETHKENRERLYTCEHCGKKFYTKKILTSHLQRCHSDKRYICQVCSYPFTDKYNLAKHLLNHDGKGKAFKCEVCSKSYSSKASYTDHQRSHSGERPFVCSYCSKTFTSKRRLTEHHKTHTGEKPHKCSVCDHSFAQRGTLTRHMKVHDRIVPVMNWIIPSQLDKIGIISSETKGQRNQRSHGIVAACSLQIQSCNCNHKNETWRG